MAKAKKSSNKLFGLNYVVILGLIIALSIGFLFGAQYRKEQNTSKEIELQAVEYPGKQYTYRDFSIRFPDNWFVHNMKSEETIQITGEEWGDNIFIASPSLQNIPMGRSFPALRVRYVENVEQKSFEEYKDYIESDKGLNLKGYLEHQEIEVDEIVGFQTKLKENSDINLPQFITTYFYINGNEVVITMDEETTADAYKVYEQILSSVTFE